MSQYSNFELKEFNTASLTSGFQNLGAALSNAAKFVHVFNTSTVDAYITNDNSTNIIRIPAGKDLPLSPYPFYGNDKESSFIFPKGTQLKVKQVTAAAAGAIVVHILT